MIGTWWHISPKNRHLTMVCFCCEAIYGTVGYFFWTFAMLCCDSCCQHEKPAEQGESEEV